MPTAKLIRIYLFIAIAIFASSCVRTKQITYLQDLSNKSVEKKGVDSKVNQQAYEYRIQTGDIFNIKITSLMETKSALINEGQWNKNAGNTNQHPHLMGYRVEESGIINLPIIGDIKAEGLTVTELRLHLSEIAKEYIAAPHVQVYMVNFYVKVLGEVNQPGSYNVYFKEPTLLDAMALAGDITDWGNRKKVKILRTVNGKVEILYANLTDRGILQSPKFYLLPNDVILIKPLAAKQFNLALVSTSLSIISTAIAIFSITSR